MRKKCFGDFISQQNPPNDFQVNTLFIFGSVVRNEASTESDVAIIVEFNPDGQVGLFQLTRLNIDTKI